MPRGRQGATSISGDPPPQHKLKAPEETGLRGLLCLAKQELHHVESRNYMLRQLIN